MYCTVSTVGNVTRDATPVALPNFRLVTRAHQLVAKGFGDAPDIAGDIGKCRIVLNFAAAAHQIIQCFIGLF